MSLTAINMNFLALASILLLATTLQHARAQSALAPASPPPPPFRKPPPPSTPCYSGMYNPCGLGSCINDGDTYRCVCPRGTLQGSRINGNPFCVPASSGGSTYNTTAGDSCYVIAVTFRLTIAQLLSLNPTLNCASIPTGLTLDVDSPIETPSSTCWIRYTVTYIDTCTSIGTRFGLRTPAILAINPGLDCNNLLADNEFLSICIKPLKERSKFYVCRQYISSDRNSSRSCRLVAKSSRRTQLFNPGLYCGRLGRSPRQYCRKAIGYNQFPSTGAICRLGQPYFITNEDSCSTLYSKFGTNLLATNVEAFKKHNTNMDCKDRFLFVGQRICVP